jgi:hypothetical protein
MKSWLRSFNIYLLVLLAGGCQSNGLSMKKDYATLRVYLETQRGSSGGGLVQVTREKIPMYVESQPVLTEEDVAKATLLDNPDGTFAVQVKFNDHGALVLDMTSSSHKGRNLVVFSHFPPRGWKEPKDQDALAAQKTDPNQPRISGWLSAVLIRSPMSNGTFQFTPDASHEEAERIVRGLNNMVTTMNKGDKEK